jgi:hypothetical protein
MYHFSPSIPFNLLSYLVRLGRKAVVHLWPLRAFSKISAPILKRPFNRPRRYPLWWLRHCFPAFKVSAKNGLFLGQMTWVKLVFLEARLRPVEQLDREVEIGCRLSWTYD